MIKKKTQEKSGRNHQPKPDDCPAVLTAAIPSISAPIESAVPMKATHQKGPTWKCAPSTASQIAAIVAPITPRQDVEVDELDSTGFRVSHRSRSDRKPDLDQNSPTAHAAANQKGRKTAKKSLPKTAAVGQPAKHLDAPDGRVPDTNFIAGHTVGKPLKKRAKNRTTGKVTAVTSLSEQPGPSMRPAPDESTRQHKKRRAADDGGEQAKRQKKHKQSQETIITHPTKTGGQSA